MNGIHERTDSLTWHEETSSESQPNCNVPEMNEGTPSTVGTPDQETSVGASSGQLVIVIDGSNIAYGGGSLKPTAERLMRLMQKFESIDAETITVIDASLRHKVPDRDRLERMLEDFQVAQAPGGREADEFIIQLVNILTGRGHMVMVMTNDAGFERRLNGRGSRIAFMVVRIGDEEVFLMDPLPSVALGNALGTDGAMKMDGKHG